MKKGFVFFLCTIIIFPVYSASFTISGDVSGKARKNVKIRLDELSKNETLTALDKSTLENQILPALQAYGYFKPRIDIDNLNIHIRTGPQLRITSLRIQVQGAGAANAGIQTTLKNIPIQQGDPLITEFYNKTKESILKTAENEGFLRGHFVKSEILINKETYTADVTLIFDTGSPFRFGKIQFDNTKLSLAFLRKFAPFSPGETFSGNKILTFNSQLSNSGYFKNVTINPEPAPDYTVPLSVITEPVPRYSYNISAGYGTDTNVRGRAGLSIIPLNEQGHVINLLGQGSFTENLAQAQYLVPGNNPVLDKYSFTGALSNLHYDSGYSNNILLTAGHTHNRPWFQRDLSFNALMERFHYDGEPDTAQTILFPKVRFGFKNIADPLFSPSGYNISLQASGAKKHVLSTLDYTQVAVDAKAALMLDSIDTRLYMHGLVSRTNTANINDLPLSLAVLLGGTQDMKGYAFHSIGPGKTVWYGGLEIQKSLFPKWYITGFFDAGKVSGPANPDTLFDIGAGLLWQSPIGPVKVGLAQPVSKHLQRIEHTGPRLIINMGADL